MAVVAATGEALRRLTGLESALTEVERRRRAAFVRASDAEDYLAAHLLLRYCVSVASGLPAKEVRIHGPARPGVDGLPDLRVSLSHTSGWIAAAASIADVGIDVEAVTARSAAHIRALDIWTPDEAEMLAAHPDAAQLAVRLWTRKEALVKLGSASLDELRRLDVLDPGGPTLSIAFVEDLNESRVCCLALHNAGSPPALECWG